MASGAEAVFAMGAAALEANDLPRAEQLFRSIVERDPRVHPAWNALSVVAVRAGSPEVAAEHARRALELDRRNPVYLNNLGVAYGELGEFAQAEEALRRALKAKPVYAEGQFNLGKVLHKRDDLKGALRAYQRAYAMDARFPGLALALAYMHLKCADAAAARGVLDGIGTRDELASIACAECLLEGADRGAALAFMRDEMRAHPDWTWLRTALGTQLLAAGDWQEGWALYLSRPFRPQSEELRHATLDALNGKRILLQGEQGIGDVLFFLRFAPQLAEVAASLTLACKRKLVPLLAAGAAASGMKVIADEAQEAGAWDVHLALGDLPACLPAARTPPAWPVAVESSAREEWGRRLAALGPPPYLGVTWRAGTDVLRRREFGNNRNLLMKEVPAARMGAALRGWRGTVLALQRGLRDGELAAFAAAAQAPAHDLAALGDDLPALAAVLSLLDEYAAVSNTNIHILAGLGRTARVLVPYPPEWRWMREGASPWFPGCGVYREPQSRGWTEPLAQLRRDLIG